MSLLGDGDTGWHLRTGDWILQNHRVPTTDMFSFTRNGEPWFAWEWGWDVVFALVHRFFGMAGVLGINILLVCVISALLFRLVRSACGNDVIAFLLITISLIGGFSIHWLARPHLVGWLFVLVFSQAIRAASEGNTRMLLWLPVLTVFWVNLHGSFFVGIAMLLVFAAGEVSKKVLFPQSEASPGPWKSYLLCGVACSLASLLNPYGWSLHQHLFSYLLDSKQLQTVAEFQSLSFHHPAARFFEIELFLAFGAAIWCVNRRLISEAVWTVLWCHLALMSGRNIPIFFLITTPVAGAMVQDLMHTARNASGKLVRKVGSFVANAGLEYRTLERLPRFYLPSLAAAGLLIFLLRFPGESQGLKSEYDPHEYPSAAVQFLAAGSVTNIVTDDIWGGYVIFKLYPHSRVFVDGRSDFYGTEFGDTYMDLMNAHQHWDRTLSRFPVDAVLLRPNTVLAAVLRESHDWKQVFGDAVAVVFRHS